MVIEPDGGLCWGVHSTATAMALEHILAGTGVARGSGWGIPFSAFWLRSSVVSVLISLFADMQDIVLHRIN